MHFRTITTDFRIFMTPYNTLLHSPSVELINSRDTLTLKFKTIVWQVHTLAKVNVEAETTDIARAWAEAKEREKVEIARIDEENKEKTEFEARARRNDNIVNRAEVEAAAKIRFSSNI